MDPDIVAASSARSSAQFGDLRAATGTRAGQAADRNGATATRRPDEAERHAGAGNGASFDPESIAQ